METIHSAVIIIIVIIIIIISIIIIVVIMYQVFPMCNMCLFVDSRGDVVLFGTRVPV